MEVKDITSILKDVYNDEISVYEAKKDMKLASPLQLALAEVELLDGDLDEGVLKEFRGIYSKIIDDKIEDTLKKINEDHPIRKLILEHIEIGKFVEELARLSEDLRNEKSRIIRKNKIENIKRKVEMIKKHEENEEDVLFPRLEEEGFFGRVHIMKNEHDEIDELMDEIVKLSEELVDNKEEFIEKTDVLTYTLDFHAFMENNFLYLVALEKLDDWDDIGDEFENIGIFDI